MAVSFPEYFTNRFPVSESNESIGKKKSLDFSNALRCPGKRLASEQPAQSEGESPRLFAASKTDSCQRSSLAEASNNIAAPDFPSADDRTLKKELRTLASKKRWRCRATMSDNTIASSSCRSCSAWKLARARGKMKKKRRRPTKPLLFVEPTIPAFIL